MGIRQGYRYNKNLEVPCPVCGKILHTPQGQQGHMRFAHSGIGVEGKAIIDSNNVTITVIEKAGMVKIIGVLKYYKGVVEDILGFWDSKRQQ